MEFTDKKERNTEEDTYVIRFLKEASVDTTVDVLKELPQTRKECFCLTQVKYVRLDEPIFTPDGVYITYRIK